MLSQQTTSYQLDSSSCAYFDLYIGRAVELMRCGLAVAIVIFAQAIPNQIIRAFEVAPHMDRKWKGNIDQLHYLFPER